MNLNRNFYTASFPFFSPKPILQEKKKRKEKNVLTPCIRVPLLVEKKNAISQSPVEN